MNSIRAANLAQQMLQQSGIADEQHGIMAQNLTRQLEKTPDAFLERFEQSGGKPTEVLPDLINEASYGMSPSVLRPLVKLDRELKQPYTDAQVGARVESVESRLRDALLDRIAKGTPYPQRMWVVGSLAGGGFGGNSDADVIVDVGAGARPIMIEDSQHQYEIMSLRHGDEAKQFGFFGSRVEVDPKKFLDGESVLMPLYLKSLPAARLPVPSPATSGE